MISNLSIRVCQIIVTCNTLKQLTAAEQYMILSGKNFTHLVQAKEMLLLDQLKQKEQINQHWMDRFNEKAINHGC